MINQFFFNDKRSYDDFELIITESPAFSVPERDIEFESIPGRSGDLIIDNGRYKNVTAEYKVTALCNNFSLPQTAHALGIWLSSGYGILSDTYDPLYFRYACPSGNLSIKNKIMQLGMATVKFNCKPFKYLFSGQETITLTASGQKIYNAEAFSSAPYIKITGGGTVNLSINNDSFVIADVDGYVELDSETMNCFKGTTLKNDKLTAAGFPEFVPGENTISWTGTVTKIEIVPRWRTL